MRKYPRIESPHRLEPGALPREPDGTVAWAEVFGRDRPLRIEVGVGNSPFLIEVAKLEPEYNYLGFEYSRKRVLKFLKKVRAAGLESIRMLPINMDLALADYFRDGTVDRVFVNFPDPWPKKRHAKRRFVRPENVERVCDLLREGGGLSARTDAPAYAAQMVEVLEGCGRLENAHGGAAFAPAPRFAFETPYEIKFKAENRTIHYLEYRKRARDRTPEPSRAPLGAAGSP